MTPARHLWETLGDRMSISKQHTCPEQISIAVGDSEPPAPNCRCRKYISTEAARKKVESEEASWIIISRRKAEIEMPCHLCHADPEVKKCANCNGSGKETKMVLIPRYGNDIVLVSRRPADKKEKKRSSSLAKKTPRVATIEAEHILRAYVSDEARYIVEMAEHQGQKIRKLIEDRTSPQAAKAARDRIEEYGRLILDARMYVGLNRIPAIIAEPEDDAKTRTGRRYDYGRAM